MLVHNDNVLQHSINIVINSSSPKDFNSFVCLGNKPEYDAAIEKYNAFIKKYRIELLKYNIDLRNPEQRKQRFIKFILMAR